MFFNKSFNKVNNKFKDEDTTLNSFRRLPYRSETNSSKSWFRLKEFEKTSGKRNFGKHNKKVSFLLAFFGIAFNLN